MVNSISNIGQFTYIQSILQSNQSQLDTLQGQISSGRKADTYGGLGGNATYQSLSLRTQIDQLTTFSSAIDNVTPVTSAMDSAMTGINTQASSVLSSLQSVVQGSADPGMVDFNAKARVALQSVQQYLNTQVGNTYVFSGTDVANAPVASTTALNTATQTDLTAFAGGTETAATVLANIAAYTPTQNGYSATLATAGSVSVRTGPNTNTNYTVKASQAGFQSIQQGLSIISNLQWNPNDQAGFYQIYNAAVNMISTGQSQVTQYQSTLGVATKYMSDMQTQISATQSVVNNSIVNVEELSSDDTAKASTLLTSLQTQLQASYTVIGQLQNLHLINFLGGGG